MPVRLEPERAPGMNFRCCWVFVEMFVESWPKEGIELGYTFHTAIAGMSTVYVGLDENPDVAMHCQVNAFALDKSPLIEICQALGDGPHGYGCFQTMKLIPVSSNWLS